MEGNKRKLTFVLQKCIKVKMLPSGFEPELSAVFNKKFRKADVLPANTYNDKFS